MKKISILIISCLLNFQPALQQTKHITPKPISKQKQVFRYLLSKTSYDSAVYLYAVIRNESGNFKSELSKHHNIAGLRYVPNSKAIARNKNQYLHYQSWKDCIDDLLTYQRFYKAKSWYYSKRYKNFIKINYNYDKETIFIKTN